MNRESPENGFGYRPPLESTTRVNHLLGEEEFTRCVSPVAENTVELPRKLVEEVVVNRVALDCLPGDFQDLASPDRMISLARLTVPISPDGALRQSEEKVILTPAMMGRSLPLAYGRVPYADAFLGTSITGKGTLASGRHYPLSDMSADSLLSGDPIGFFGDRDGEKELEISNLLLESGGRTSLALGYLVLKDKELEDFILRTYGKQMPSVARVLVSHLEKVKFHRDKPICLLRLGGPNERQTILGLSGNGSKAFVSRRRAAIAQGARVMLAEADEFPENFHRYLLGQDLETAKLVLGEISDYGCLDDRGTESMHWLLTGICVQEALAYGRTVKARPDLVNLDYTFADPKDRDFAFYGYDYEGGYSPGRSIKASLKKAVRSLVVLAEKYSGALASQGFRQPTNSLAFGSVNRVVFNQLATQLPELVAEKDSTI